MPDIERDVVRTVIELGPVTTDRLWRGWGYAPCDVALALMNASRLGLVTYGPSGWVEAI